jgi:hypothetical protein
MNDTIAAPGRRRLRVIANRLGPANVQADRTHPASFEDLLALLLVNGLAGPAPIQDAWTEDPAQVA